MPSTQRFDVIAWTMALQGPSDQVWTLPSGELRAWDYGVLCFAPHQLSRANKAIVLSCGVHGNETAPIEIVADIVHDVLAERLQPRHPVLFLFGNPWAMQAGVREVRYNMNRLFSGAHQQGEAPEQRRAADLERYVSRFFAAQGALPRLHYDLHTAIRDSYYEKFAIYPFQHGRSYSIEQLRFLAACDIHTILLNRGPTTTFSYYSVSQHQAQAFTVELGKVRPFGQNDRSRFQAADHSLRQLLMQPSLPQTEWPSSRLKVFDVARVINRTNSDFRLHFADDVANFTEFPLGYQLVTDGDTQHFVEQQGERIIFPNAQVALGQRALLLVRELPLQQLDLV